MAAKLMRKIVRIDEARCNGCGQCVPGCDEGAIEIIDGKARLRAENLCDGLGACLGQCPMGAITIEDRPADAFDEQAVHQHLHPRPAAQAGRPAAHGGHQGGCPGSMPRKFQPAAAAAPAGGQGQAASRLGHWPVQLALVPAQGDIWQGADVLFCADCVPFAMPDFHGRMLAGKTLAVACPKLDDAGAYVDKLAEIFAHNDIKAITVAHMEVPCCFGLERIVRDALERSGKDIPLTAVEVSIGGAVLATAASGTGRR